MICQEYKELSKNSKNPFPRTPKLSSSARQVGKHQPISTPSSVRTSNKIALRYDSNPINDIIFLWFSYAYAIKVDCQSKIKELFQYLKILLKRLNNRQDTAKLRIQYQVSNSLHFQEKTWHSSMDVSCQLTPVVLVDKSTPKSKMSPPDEKWMINILMPQRQYCQFCSLYSQSTTTKLVIAQSDELFAFHDLSNASAEAHILVCTKDHIETALDISSHQALDKMETFGRQVLTKIFRDRFGHEPKADHFRFGFHLQPYISVYHVHLHCFILPFKNKVYDLVVYGYGKMFRPVAQIKKMKAQPKL